MFDSKTRGNTQNLFGLSTLWTDRKTMENFFEPYDDSIHDQGMHKLLSMYVECMLI